VAGATVRHRWYCQLLDRAARGGVLILTTHARPAYTATQAPDRLKAGNARFVSGRARFPTVQRDVLAELAKGQQPFAALLSAAVEANVRHTMRRVLDSPEAKARANPDDMQLVGAVYDLATGRVRFLE
jgi:carbonic anhydrase